MIFSQMTEKNMILEEADNINNPALRLKSCKHILLHLDLESKFDGNSSNLKSGISSQIPKELSGPSNWSEKNYS